VRGAAPPGLLGDERTSISFSSDKNGLIRRTWLFIFFGPMEPAPGYLSGISAHNTSFLFDEHLRQES